MVVSVVSVVVNSKAVVRGAAPHAACIIMATPAARLVTDVLLGDPTDESTSLTCGGRLGESVKQSRDSDCYACQYYKIGAILILRRIFITPLGQAVWDHVYGMPVQPGAGLVLRAGSSQAGLGYTVTPVQYT